MGLNRSTIRIITAITAASDHQAHSKLPSWSRIIPAISGDRHQVADALHEGRQAAGTTRIFQVIERDDQAHREQATDPQAQQAWPEQG